MKRYILSAFIGLLGLGAANTAEAQNFTVAHDTVWYTVHTNANIYDSVMNTSSSNLELKWKVISHDFPANWVEGTGICDNVVCYSTGVLGGTQYTTGLIDPSGYLDFHLQINLTDADPGTHYVTVEMTEALGTPKNMTFIITKYANSVKKTLKADDNLMLYPNPAQREVNINLNSVQNVKTIAIYNMIGRVMSINRVSGTTARLDISNMPQGVYIMRFMDAQGGIVTTRKFMHQ